MSLYAYVKAPPGYTLKQPKSPLFYLKVALSVVLVTIGVASLTTVAFPLVSYQLAFAPRFEKNIAVSPLSEEVTVKTAKADGPTFLPEMVNTTFDYTDADNWFPQSPQAQDAREITTYFLSIPKLGIQNARVAIGAKDLKQSLIHYGGTANPGAPGNAVIFGHSVLPQFFSPTNYTSIFSTLYTLKKGDEIIINYDEIVYRYVIKEMYEVVPTDLSPLEQSYNTRQLTLITCTPPGTYLRRLIIKAGLQ